MKKYMRKKRFGNRFFRKGRTQRYIKYDLLTPIPQTQTPIKYPPIVGILPLVVLAIFAIVVVYNRVFIDPILEQGLPEISVEVSSDPIIAIADDFYQWVVDHKPQLAFTSMVFKPLSTPEIGINLPEFGISERIASLLSPLDPRPALAKQREKMRMQATVVSNISFPIVGYLWHSVEESTVELFTGCRDTVQMLFALWRQSQA